MLEDEASYQGTCWSAGKPKTSEYFENFGYQGARPLKCICVIQYRIKNQSKTHSGQQVVIYRMSLLQLLACLKVYILKSVLGRHQHDVTALNCLFINQKEHHLGFWRKHSESYASCGDWPINYYFHLLKAFFQSWPKTNWEVLEEGWWTPKLLGDDMIYIWFVFFILYKLGVLSWPAFSAEKNSGTINISWWCWVVLMTLSTFLTVVSAKLLSDGMWCKANVFGWLWV